MLFLLEHILSLGSLFSIPEILLAVCSRTACESIVFRPSVSREETFGRSHLAKARRRYRKGETGQKDTAVKGSERINNS